jgi:hypothetical protein
MITVATGFGSQKMTKGLKWDRSTPVRTRKNSSGRHWHNHMGI